MIIANAANAAIEGQQIKLAGEWVDRATGKMNDDPRVMRERERYLFHEGKYAESAKLGYKVLQQLPKDRNASVYLDYDLYNLGRYDDALTIANQYGAQLPKEPNFPLLAGHVHKHTQLLNEAVDDYTQAIERDPKMVEAYVNRGYVLNDMQNAEQASQDFEAALKLSPEQWHRPSRAGIQRSAASSAQTGARPGGRRAEVNGRVGRDPLGACDSLSTAALAGQCGEGISRGPKVRA